MNSDIHLIVSREVETNTIDIGDGIPVDDILETVHHFRAIDYCIDIAEEPLSEDFIKRLHYILKHDTKDSNLPWFAVGDYKKRANIIEDSKKGYYYRGLSNWNSEKGYLIDTCLDGQDTVNALLQVFEINDHRK